MAREYTGLLLVSIYLYFLAANTQSFPSLFEFLCLLVSKFGSRADCWCLLSTQTWSGSAQKPSSLSSYFRIEFSQTWFSLQDYCSIKEKPFKHTFENNVLLKNILRPCWCWWLCGKSTVLKNGRFFALSYKKLWFCTNKLDFFSHTFSCCFFFTEWCFSVMSNHSRVFCKGPKLCFIGN